VTADCLFFLPEEDRVRKHLAILEREVATANRIVTDLLDFARVKTPTRLTTDLNEVVRDVLERTPVAGTTRVVLDLAADLPRVSVDPEQVGQVLGNLVTNAVQAMPDGGTLTLPTARADGGVAVTVADTGAGIAPEHPDKIFQPLFTTKAKGIGLGLAVARDLAEANGGTIEVESVPGRAAGSWCGLPGRAGRRRAVSPPSVLVVDDDVGTVETLADIAPEGLR